MSIIDLANSNNVTNVDLSSSGGEFPFAITFDQTGQRVFTANRGGASVSIIDLANSNNVTNVDPVTGAFAITFDSAGQRVFTTGGSTLSIVDLVNSNNVTNVDLGSLVP